MIASSFCGRGHDGHTAEQLATCSLLLHRRRLGNSNPNLALTLTQGGIIELPPAAGGLSHYHRHRWSNVS